MILINSDYRISGDEHQYILQFNKRQYYTGKIGDLKELDTPKDKWVDIGFYTNIEAACWGCINHKGKELANDNTDLMLAMAINILRDLKKEVFEVIKEVK